MKTVCSFCNAVVREGSGKDGRISHGVCLDCHKQILTRYGFNARKFLDLFDAPVFLVDDDARVLAANHRAVSLAGETIAMGSGRFCGDVLSCINAFLENGCGRTKYCPDCVFRNSITHTYMTGQPVTDRPATLCRRTGNGKEDVGMLVSTRRDGNAVLLRLRPVRVP